MRDVIAPRLHDLRAALQQVGPLIRLNHPASRNVGEAGFRDLRRDTGLGHPRPCARTESVNRRGGPRLVEGRAPARSSPTVRRSSRETHPRRLGRQRPRPLKHIERARAQRDTELAPGLHPRRRNRPPPRLHVDLVPKRPARLSSPHRVNATISTHNTADGWMYLTRRIVPSAAATSRCGRAR